MRFRWRLYRTGSGRSPVKEFFTDLSEYDYAAIVGAMKEAETEGLAYARHIDGDLYELRVTGLKASYRLLFAQEAKFILLAVDVFAKETQKLPLQIKRRALERLRDWRLRGHS